MPQQASPAPESLVKKQNPIMVVSLFLFYLSAVGRTLVKFSDDQSLAEKFWIFVAGELVFLVLFTLAVWVPRIPSLFFHIYLGIQSLIVAGLFIYEPDVDFVTGLFICLGYQVATYYSGRTRWIWIAIFVSLMGGIVWFFANPVRGLALQLTTIAGIVVITAYTAASQEANAARLKGQTILNELEETHRQLEAMSGQVEELTVIEERNRLARDLHDSVSQTMFSINLNIQSARMMLKKDPERLRVLLQTLVELCQSALVEMRSLITQLRPKSE